MRKMEIHAYSIVKLVKTLSPNHLFPAIDLLRLMCMRHDFLALLRQDTGI